MTTPADLEERLRAGLRSAADALPEPGAQNLRMADSTELRPRWRRPALATAAVVVAVAGVVAVVARDDSAPEPTEGDVRVAEASTTTTAATTPSTTVAPRKTNGMTPGVAVITGGELRTFNPDGTPQGGPIDLAPMTLVQAAASDLEGGWVVCGSDAEIQDHLIWYPADGDPVELAASFGCMSESVRVVDSAEGPMVLVSAHRQLSHAGEGGAPPPPFLHGVVLATGESRTLPVSLPPGEGAFRWAATTDRALVHREGGRFHLFDMATGAELPMADVDFGLPSHIALAPDGASAAVLVGDAFYGPVDLIVFDLATGAERLRRSFPMPAEGDEMSYDDTRVAVGNFYADRVPVTVIDLTTGAEHTIDAHGIVL